MLPGLYLFMFLLLLLTACAWICLNFVLLVPIVCLHMCVCMHTHTHTSDPWSGECTQRFKCTVLFFATPCGSPLEKATKAQTASVRGTSSSLPLPPSPFLCHSVSPLTQSSLFDSSAEAQAARLSRFEQRRNKGVLIMDYSVRLYGATALLKTEIRTARDSRGLEDFLAPRTS